MQETQKKKIIIIDDELHLSQGYALNIAKKLGLKFDIMNPRGSEGDIYLFLNHREADDWLHLHPRECAVILSDQHIARQELKGSKWILDKLKGSPFQHIPMILMDRFINGEGEALIEAGFPKDRIVCKLKEEDIYEAVVDAYNKAKNAPFADKSDARGQAL